MFLFFFFFFSSRRRHTRFSRDWSSDVCSSDLGATLADFIKQAASVAPARHYALIMWDHGGGIYGFNQDNEDGTAPDIMTPAGLATGVANAGVPIDVIGFDACL